MQCPQSPRQQQPSLLLLCAAFTCGADTVERTFGAGASGCFRQLAAAVVLLSNAPAHEQVQGVEYGHLQVGQQRHVPLRPLPMLQALQRLVGWQLRTS
jgi:hypothetical protein